VTAEAVVTLEGGCAAQTPALSANFLKVEIAGASLMEAHISASEDKGVLAGRIIPVA
jgi:hypothetical protein